MKKEALLYPPKRSFVRIVKTQMTNENGINREQVYKQVRYGILIVMMALWILGRLNAQSIPYSHGRIMYESGLMPTNPATFSNQTWLDRWRNALPNDMLNVTVPQQITCGNFKVVYADVIAANGIGFDDSTYGSLRRDAMCGVLTYLSTKIQTGSATPIIYVDISEEDSTGFLVKASPTYSSNISGGVLTDGALHDYLVSGNNPLPSGVAHAYIKMDFGDKGVPVHNDYTTPCNFGIDVYSTLLFAMTRNLGLFSLIHPNGTSLLSASALGPFSSFDSNLYANNAYLLDNLYALQVGLSNIDTLYYNNSGNTEVLPMSFFDYTSGFHPYSVIQEYCPLMGLRTFGAEDLELLCDAGYSLTGNICQNHYPLTTPDVVYYTPGQTLCFNPLVNDTDADGDSLFLDVSSLWLDSTAGTFSVSGNQICFTPDSGFLNNMIFQYKVSDNTGLSNYTPIIVYPQTIGNCPDEEICSGVVNLIPNPNFELGIDIGTYNSLGFDVLDIYFDNSWPNQGCWHRVDCWCRTTGSPDILIRGGNAFGLPEFGMDTPFGDRAGGFVYGPPPNSSGCGNGEWFEGIQTELVSPLSNNKYYRLRFYANTALQSGNSSSFVSNMLIGFSSNSNPPPVIPGHAHNSCSHALPNTTPDDGFVVQIHNSGVMPDQYIFPPVGVSAYKPSVDIDFLFFESMASSVNIYRILLDNLRLYEVPNIIITKTVSNPNPALGQVYDYTITVENLGTNTYYNINVYDPLSPLILYGGAGTYNPNTLIPSLGPNQSYTFTIPAYINPIINNDICDGTAMDLRNCAWVTAVDGFQACQLEEIYDCVAVEPHQTDISVTQTITQMPNGVMTPMEYTITVTNNGAFPVSNVIIGSIPDCMVYDPDHPIPNSPFYYNPLDQTFTIMNLCAGCSTTITVNLYWIDGTVDCELCSSLIGFAEEGVSLLECNEVNNSDCNTIPAANVNISVEKVVSNPYASVGDIITYTIYVTNTSNFTATGVNIEDVIPPCISNAQITNPLGLTFYNNTLTLASIPPLSDVQIVITGELINGMAECKNCAELMTPLIGQNETNPEDDEGCASIFATELDLSVAKTLQEDAPGSGFMNFILTVTNNGIQNAAEVQLEDIWDGGDCFSFVGFSCEVPGTTVTNTYNTQTEQGHSLFEIPLVPAGSSVQITVTLNKNLHCIDCQNCVSLVGFNGFDTNEENNSDCDHSPIDYSTATLALNEDFIGDSNYPGITGNYPHFIVNGTTFSNIKIIVAPYATVEFQGQCTIEDCEVEMLEGSTMDVIANCDLNIKRSINGDCYIHGCDRMWQGISVWEKGRIFITGSSTSTDPLNVTHPVRIEDAAYAVYIRSYVNSGGVPIYNLQSGVIQKTFFNRNYVGIMFSAGNSPQTTLIQDALLSSLNQNTFDCLSPLLPPYIGINNSSVNVNPQVSSIYDNVFPRNVSYAGIEIHRHFSISPIRDINTFIRLNNGIVAFSSDLTYSPSNPLNLYGLQRFMYIKAYDTPKNFYDGSGFYTDGLKMGGYLNYTGRGGNLNTIPDFVDCDYGVYSYNTHLKFKEHYMQNVNTGIYTEEGMPFLNSATVHNNRIEGKQKGLHIVPIEGSGTYYIHHNDIYMNDGNPLSNPFLVNSFGIGVTGMNLQSSVLIEENAIEMQDCDLGVFTLAGSKFFQCRSNTVNITGSNNYAAYYNAGTPNAIFECNTATGTAGVMGYKIDMSPQTSLICNMTQGAAVGMGFWGPSPNTKVLGNTFHSNGNYGLFYSSSAVTGVQDNTGNKWIGTQPSVWGAYHDSPIFNFVTQSKYLVVPFASPYTPYSWSSNSGGAWFAPNATSSLYSCDQNPYCGVPAGGNIISNGDSSDITGLDKLIATDSLQTENYEAEIKREAEAYLYTKINTDSTLLGVDVEVDAFYTNKSQTNIGDFEVVKKQTMELSSNLNSVLLQSLQNEKEFIRSQIEMQDSLYALATAPQDSASIEQSRDSLINQLRIMTDSLASLLSLNDSLYRMPLNDSLQAINQQISVTLQQEWNEKRINELYLQSLRFGLASLDSLQVGDVGSIAIQCPLAGGGSVYRARSLHALLGQGKWLYDDENNCNTVGLAWRKPQSTVLEKELIVYPNPAHTQITFGFTKPIEKETKLFIINGLGQVVTVLCIPEYTQSYRLEVNKWTKGIYYYQCLDTPSISGKFIID